MQRARAPLVFVGRGVPRRVVPQDFMIAAVEKAGFKLVATSEINANPKDTKDWPRGALTLPPQFALGDKDRDRYAAIGESDCMTLRFVRL